MHKYSETCEHVHIHFKNMGTCMYTPRYMLHMHISKTCGHVYACLKMQTSQSMQVDAHCPENMQTRVHMPENTCSPNTQDGFYPIPCPTKKDFISCIPGNVRDAALAIHRECPLCAHPSELGPPPCPQPTHSRRGLTVGQIW